MRFSDFKGNFKQINEFKSLLFGDECKTVLVVGDNGTGKSSLYDMLADSKKFDILSLNDMNFSEQTIQNFITCKTITSFFSKLQKLVFIDDIDTISNMNKTVLRTLASYKSQCRMVFTVKSKEEKKIYNTWKKIIDHKITLNKLDFKECFQIMLKRTEDRDDIDQSKLLALIKAQNCNLSNVIMLLDSVTHDYEDIDVLESNMDTFHTNMYTTVSDMYNKELDEVYINSIASKDNSILSSMIHENVTNLKTNIDVYIALYDIFTECDIVDKHIYITCTWGPNWESINYYRFKSVNKLLFAHKSKPFPISFTQQFTKLSSQMNIKKKLHSFVNSIYLTNTLDLLQFLHTKAPATSSNTGENAKIIKDLVSKYKKDFNL